MNWFLVVTGILELLLSLILGVLFIYGIFTVFRKSVPQIDDLLEVKRGNTAVAIVNGSMIIAVIIILQEALDPAMQAFMLTAGNPNAATSDYLVISLIILGQVLLCAVVAFGGIYAALRLFMFLTKDLEEIEEIRKGNTAAAILLASVIIGIALLIGPSLVTLLDAVIPFPPVPFNSIGAL